MIVGIIAIGVFVILFLAGFVDMAKLNKKELDALGYERMMDGNYKDYDRVVNVEPGENVKLVHGEFDALYKWDY
jgi:hypothetical protein